MTWSVALRLGRVSNLPTVWSNVLAGMAIAGAPLADPRLLPLLLGLSLLYVAGMFLNDAFDREIDARERPDRPIPSGAVTARAVFIAGFGMMAAGLLLLATCETVAPGAGLRAAAAGLVLCLLIVFYDARHKGNPFSPVVMAACRSMVYVTAGMAIIAEPTADLAWTALALAAWVVGLTYTAMQENLNRVDRLWPLLFLAAPLAYGASLGLAEPLKAALWIALVGLTVAALFLIRRRQPGDIGRAVVTMIAGISLIDALFIAHWGSALGAGLAVGAFVLTLAFQRFIPGT